MVGRWPLVSVWHLLSGRRRGSRISSPRWLLSKNTDRVFSMNPKTWCMRSALSLAMLVAWAVISPAQSPPTQGAPAQGAPAAPVVTHPLKKDVYFVEGGGGNSGVIVGQKGVIVVDAKTTAAGGKELLDQIAKITPKPVTTVVLTHSDGDHVNGLAAFPKS